MIIRPRNLQAGDKIALVAPAYWLPEDAFVQTVRILESWGLVPVIGKHVASNDAQVYSGTADERAADLMWAFEDDDIKAVLCIRGGYGSIHLLKRVPLECYRQHPKWLIGNGDITTLLNSVVAAGVMSIHGPMGFQIAYGQGREIPILHDLLFGKVPRYEIPGHANNRCGHAEGILIGGNLSSYSPIAGTEFHISPDQDVILFIEEAEEALHHIDRLFYLLGIRLRRERVKGIIFGLFHNIKYDLQFDSVEQMLAEHFSDTDIPICCGFPVGTNNCLPLIEGAPCSLDVTMDSASLAFNIDGEQQTYQIDKEEVQLFL